MLQTFYGLCSECGLTEDITADDMLSVFARMVVLAMSRERRAPAGVCTSDPPSQSLSSKRWIGSIGSDIALAPPKRRRLDVWGMHPDPHSLNTLSVTKCTISYSVTAVTALLRGTLAVQ